MSSHSYWKKKIKEKSLKSNPNDIRTETKEEIENWKKI